MATDFSFIHTVYLIDDNGSGKPVKIKQLFVPLVAIGVVLSIVFLICMYCRATSLRKMYFENQKILRAKQLESAETQAMLAKLKRDVRAALHESRKVTRTAQRASESASSSTLQRVTSSALQRMTSSALQRVSSAYYTSKIVEIFDKNRDNSLSREELGEGLQELGMFRCFFPTGTVDPIRIGTLLVRRHRAARGRPRFGHARLGHG